MVSAPFKTVVHFIISSTPQASTSASRSRDYQRRHLHLLQKRAVLTLLITVIPNPRNTSVLKPEVFSSITHD